MFIRTQRLFLRPAWPEDADEIYERINDEPVIRHLARAPWPYTPADARRFAVQDELHRFPRFLVTSPRERGRIVGSIGLVPTSGDPELEYWTARDRWNRGFATEAVCAVLSLAATLGHSRLVAATFVDNPASARVLAKAGFHRTGELVQRCGPGRQRRVDAVVHAVALSSPLRRQSPLEPGGDSRMAA